MGKRCFYLSKLFSDQPFPQLIHFVPQGQLYAFGQGLSGQLGIKTPHNRNLPQAVVGPWRSPGGVSLLNYSEELEEETPRVYVRKVRRRKNERVVEGVEVRNMEVEKMEDQEKGNKHEL